MELAPVRSEAFALLAQVLLSVDALGGASGQVTEAGGLTLEPLGVGDVPATYDLNFTVATDAPGQPWQGSIVYATDLFTRESVEVLADRFVRLLGELVSAPEVPVGSVDLLMLLSGLSWCRWCRVRVWCRCCWGICLRRRRWRRRVWWRWLMGLVGRFRMGSWMSGRRGWRGG